MDEYEYYDDPIYIAIVKESATSRSINYKIRSVEKICDDLWAVHVSQNNGKSYERSQYTHFVFIVNNEKRISTNVVHLPEEYRNAIDTERYTIPDGIYIEDIR